MASALLVVLAALLALLPGIHLLLRRGEHPGIVLGVLLEVLDGDAVAGELRVAGELIVLLDHLGRGSAHLALGAGTVEDAVDDVAALRAVAVLVPRTGLACSHTSVIPLNLPGTLRALRVVLVRVIGHCIPDARHAASSLDVAAVMGSVRAGYKRIRPDYPII